MLNAAKSEIHPMSGNRVNVKPHIVSFTFDSLAVVSGTRRDTKRSLTIDLGVDDC